jgi:hypothetical protein
MTLTSSGVHMRTSEERLASLETLLSALGEPSYQVQNAK